MRRVAGRLLEVDPADVEILEVSRTVGTPEEVVALVEETGARALEAVLPLGLLAGAVPALQRRGIPVLRALMERDLHEDGFASFRFTGYELVERVEVVTRRLD